MNLSRRAVAHKVFHLLKNSGEKLTATTTARVGDNSVSRPKQEELNATMQYARPSIQYDVVKSVRLSSGNPLKITKGVFDNCRVTTV